MIGSLVIVIAVIAVLLSLCFQGDLVITGKKIILGHGGYDMEKIRAPVAKSSFLSWFSYLVADTRFGPSIRRFLLADNHISNLRELSAQIKLPPLHFPMRRIADPHADYSMAEDFDEIVEYGMRNYKSFSRNSIFHYASAYRNGEKPSDVLNRTIEQVLRWKEEGFRIFSSFLPDDIMIQAFESDERFLRGEPISIFDGVPIVVKDMASVKYHVIYDGKNPSPEFRDLWVFGAEDDIIVARLREQGAIIFGVTIMTEGGVTPLGYNAHFKGPLNPYSTSHYSGGSSSGSAVAVASGLVPLAIGFDGGGSIRIPSCLSGIHGLATTFGRLPMNSSIESTMIKGGPMAATALDAALALAIMSPNAPFRHFYNDLYDGNNNGPPKFVLSNILDTEDLSDIRIGVFQEWFNDADEEIRQLCHASLQSLEARGATIVSITIPHLRWMALAHGIKISTEFAMLWDEIFHVHKDSMEPNTKITVGLGSSVTALEALAADRLRAWAFKYVTELFDQYQLTAIANPAVGIETPEISIAAQEVGESNTGLVMRLMSSIFLANFLGLPGYSVPVGYLSRSPVVEGTGETSKTRGSSTSNNSSYSLPVGLHLMGNHWQEHQLLRLAHALDTVSSNNYRQPFHFFDPLKQ